MMFQAITFCLLVTSSISLPHPQAREDERGFFIDVLGGLLEGETTTAAPAESTTMATLYGDLVVSRRHSRHWQGKIFFPSLSPVITVKCLV